MFFNTHSESGTSLEGLENKSNHPEKGEDRNSSVGEEDDDRPPNMWKHRRVALLSSRNAGLVSGKWE
eukprot:8094950-Prorocentrum_lima.AAC.1